MDKEAIQKLVLDKIIKAKDHKDTKIKPKDLERLQRYRADKDFYAGKLPNLTAYSFTDTSIMSAVERMTAQIIKMVFGNSDIGSMKGRNADDDKNAATMQELCNWQVEYANAGYQKFYWWIKECLYQLYSVVMVTQKREYEEVEEDIQIPAQAAEEFMQQAIANKIDVVEVAEGVMQDQTGQQLPCYNVKIKYMKLTANYPLIENVPSEELIWTPGAKTLDESELVGRRKQVTIDYLVRNIKKKQADGTYTGMYDKKAVMELTQNGSNTASDDIMDEARGNESDGSTYDVDDPNRKVWITECFVKADINNDKMLEDCIMTVVEEGNIFIRYEKNEDGFPFCVISPVFDPFRVVPDVSGIDALGQVQDILTAVYRLTIQNLALNNNPQQLCNSASFVDFNQVLDGDQFIEINSLPGEAMGPVTEVPLAGYTLPFIELLKGMGEEKSGVNSYNQGLDSSTMNKTATGITALISQGSEVLTLVLRNIAETGLKRLFMRMIFLNQKYVDHDQVVRLTGEDIVVNKDNLKGDFDYVVEAGLGSGVRETDVKNMFNVMQMMPTLIQGGIATTKNAYNGQKKYLELVGIKDTEAYLTEPQAQPQGQDQAKVSESIQAKITDAPWQIQMQHWQKLGYQVDPQMFMQQQDMALQVKQQEAQAKQQADMQSTVVKAQIQDHQSDKQHQQNLQSSQIHNNANERGMMINNNARERQTVMNNNSRNDLQSNKNAGQEKPVMV